MKMKIWNKLISMVMALVMFVSAGAIHVYASGDETPGKYVSEVFIAYGKTEEEAVNWLKDNGWEPIKGSNDFCAGKASFWDKSISAAMGIKRTNDATDAITDMAVMNMKGGYNLPSYTELLNQKKAEIAELINLLMEIISEYRENYNGSGSEFGRERATLVHEMLNRFYDGDPNGKYAVNDTGLPLGDLLLSPMRSEAGGENGGDLNQILLESSGSAMLAVEMLLSMAADSAETTWIERLSGLSADTIAENIGEYVPEAAGQDLPASAIRNYLKQQFGDRAQLLADQWITVHESVAWYEKFNEDNGLWQEDGEDDEAYAERVNAFFEKLKEEDEEKYKEISEKYNYNGILYINLYDIEYSGDWGDTLGDFFNPADGTDYSTDTDIFLPMAAALSKGQAAALEFVSLTSIILVGLQDEMALEQAMTDIDYIFEEDLDLSIYLGVNRGAFRNGVAITSRSLMEQNMGRGAAFDKIWDTTGIVAMTNYCSAVIGIVSIIAGAKMVSKSNWIKKIMPSQDKINGFKTTIDDTKFNLQMGAFGENQTAINKANATINRNQFYLDQANSQASRAAKYGLGGRILLGIGGVLLIASAILSVVQMYQYYQRTFTPIPRMIVDESDIVTYLTDEKGNPLLDENGKQKKTVEFNTYEYYDAVKCNRPQVGEISDWQDGVSDYAAQGCADIADLNGDFGQEWLALYTVKSENKGKPILADSLTLQYGSSSQPDGTTKSLHFFTYTSALDLGDMAYSYNNDKKGVYFFWDEDVNAGEPATASAFSAGTLAIAAVAGLVVGAAGAVLIMYFMRKRKVQEEA